MIARLMGLLVVSLLLVGLLLRSQLMDEPLKVSGHIEADEIRVGSRVGGRVAAVAIVEGQRVTAGTLLLELEPFDLNERLAQASAEREARRATYEKLLAGFRNEEKAEARADLQQVTAELEKLKQGPREQEVLAARARLRLAQAELELSQLQLARTKSLFESNASSREEMDDAITQHTVSQETVQVRESELDLLLEGTRPEDIAAAEAIVEKARQQLLLRETGYRLEDVAEAKASLAAAEAAVAVIEDQKNELKVVAPLDGTVEAVDLQAGDLVAPNSPAISIMDTSTLWVRAYVPENRLSIKVGQQVAVTVDSYPDQRFQGHISFISRQAEFTPGNVQTSKERSKQVFRIKVVLDTGVDVLRPGMSADVWLEQSE